MGVRHAGAARSVLRHGQLFVDAQHERIAGRATQQGHGVAESQSGFELALRNLQLEIQEPHQLSGFVRALQQGTRLTEFTLIDQCGGEWQRVPFGSGGSGTGRHAVVSRHASEYSPESAGAPYHRGNRCPASGAAR